MENSPTRSFVERYLQAYQCQITESTPHYIHTQLSIEADQDLSNRPFYWMYVERMNLQPQPIQICFVFDAEHAPNDRPSELMFAGSPRLQLMWQSAQKNGRFVSLYQENANYMPLAQSRPFIPWLAVNLFISYICDQKKDRIAHLGFNLITGEMKDNFHQQLLPHNWHNQLPPHRHLLPQKVPLREALGEMEYHIEEQLQTEDQTWATNAQQRLQRELEQIKLYYPDSNRSEELQQEKQQRMTETVWQYQPRVEVRVINAGLFHVDSLS